MKNCDEMVKSLLDRRAKYNLEQQRKKRYIIRSVTSLGCVCIVALLGLGVWQSGLFDTNPTQTTQDALYPGIKDWYGPNEKEPSLIPNNDENISNQDSNRKLLFAINKITETINAAPLYRDPALHYNEIWDFKKTVDYLGLNIPQLVERLSTDLNLQYDENNEFSVVFKNDGTLVEDRICYSFTGNHDEKLAVLVSKLKAPYDSIYVSDTNEVTNIRIPETDIIVPLRVYNSLNEVDTESKYGFYVIDFEYEGNFYRIKSENILSIYLDYLVRDIIQ